AKSDIIMHFNSKLLLLICLVGCTVKTKSKQSSSLNIGDVAPDLRVSEWIKGTPVQKFERGKVYVLEFWATWCRPCLAGMPHLSALARKYKDKVTVIAIDIYEWQLKPKKSPGQVKAFVDSLGSKMDFSVAIKDSNFTVKDWIEKTGEEHNGIPRTFIIDAEGRLAWIGHASKLDRVLSQIVDNTWNIEKERTRRDLNKQLAVLDDSLQYELTRFIRNGYDINDTEKPDSALLTIDEMVKKEPNLKYARRIASYTFAALLHTDLHKAYEYGKMAIVTPSYDGYPLNDIISLQIEHYSEKLQLTPEIYELGAKAYQVEIDQIPYPELANMPKLYSNMAQMYWRAKNKVKAIESQQTAIELLKSREDLSKKNIAAYESKLRQYKNM
ncbi:MAG: TlpA family protein disulfide reductase, partial [Flavisolibacter sp.]|nr:TlpA family protein disulfide reductase [Flavisolibacter sp.]